jgi:hypothetical protein
MGLEVYMRLAKTAKMTKGVQTLVFSIMNVFYVGWCLISSRSEADGIRASESSFLHPNENHG